MDTFISKDLNVLTTTIIFKNILEDATTNYVFILGKE